jgi:hypothetical protein
MKCLKHVDRCFSVLSMSDPQAALNSALSVIVSQLPIVAGDGRITFTGVRKLIWEVAAKGVDMRPFHYPANPTVASAALVMATAWATENTAEKQALALTTVIVCGVGDLQWTVLGGAATAAEVREIELHPMFQAGLWWATKRSGKTFQSVMGGAPHGSMPPMPPGAGCCLYRCCGMMALLLAASLAGVMAVALH